MSRKVLSLVVALAVVLSSMSFAFAATTSTSIVSGITDDKQASAVGKLFALGMTDGLDDGTFGAAKNLTRAEAAAFIVRALGLDSAAKAAAGQATSFTDVPATHWAAGYVSIAQGQGLVNGVGNGMFAPEAQVTYAQTITMLVRALGYQDSFLKGTWPGNYLAKAADAKVTKSVVFSPDGIANRGAVAQLLGNTLDATVVKVSEYAADGTAKFAPAKDAAGNEISMISDKLEITKWEDYRIVGDYRLGGSAVDTLALKDSAGAASTCKKADGLDYQSLIGAKVNLYVDTSGATNKIVFVEKAGISEVIFDSIDKIVDTDNSNLTPEFKTKIGGKSLTFDNGATFYYNTDADANVTVNTTVNNSVLVESHIKGGAYGRFVLEGNKVVFAELYGGATKWNYEALLVKSVSGNVIKYYDNNGTEKSLDIGANYAGGAIVRIDSKAATLADLKPYDVIYIMDDNYDSKTTANMFVVRSTTSGKVNGAKGTGTMDIGGTGIDVGDKATYSTNNDVDLKALAGASVTTCADDTYGATVTIYKDIVGKIRHLTADVVTTSSEKYGIIKKVNKEGETVKIYTQDGSDVVYSFEDVAKIGYLDSTAGTHLTSVTLLDTNADAGDTTAVENGDYVFAAFKLTKDGKIAKDTLILKSITSKQEAIADDFGTTTLTTTAVKYVDTKNVAVFDTAAYKALTTADIDIATWDSLSGKDLPAPAMNVILFTKDETKGTTTGDVTGLFVTTGTASSSTQVAYAISQYTRDGDTYAKVHKYGATAPVEIKLNGTFGVNESVQLVKDTSGGKINIGVVDADYQTVGGKVYKIDGDKYSLTTDDGATATTYKMASDAIVYSGDGLKSVSNIQEGDMIVGILKIKEGKILIAEWNVSDSSAYACKAVINTTNIATEYTWATGTPNMIYDSVAKAYLTSVPAGRTGYVWKKKGETGARSLLLN